MPDKDVSIIIVNWNTKNFLLDCLKSLAAGIGRMTYEVWVVDNASIDGSLEAVQDLFPEVKLLKNLDNVGFARANNQAAQLTSGRFLLFLNPDTITTAGAIESLVAYADEHPDIGILGPKILYPDHSLQRSAWREFPGFRNALVDALYLWKFPWLPFVHSNEYTRQDLAIPCDVGHLLGASLLVRQHTWAQVGPFDGNYFLFLEETELCYQARRNGWRIVYNPNSEIIHYGRQSVIQRPYESYPHLYRSYCRFYRKNNPGSRAGLGVIKIIIAMACFIRILIWALRSLYAANSDERQRAIDVSRGYCHVVFELGEY